ELMSLCPARTRDSRAPAHGSTALPPRARAMLAHPGGFAETTATAHEKRMQREKSVARLPLIDPDATSGDIRASFDRMNVKLNIFRMMAHAETNMIPAMRFANSILHKQKLSHVNRELLILQVAHIEGGEYEWRQHVPI